MVGGTIPMPPEVDVLVTLEREMWVRYFNAAAAALWTYDVLLNLDVELTHIWASLDPRKRPFRLKTAIFNLMYLAQRYMPLFDCVFLDHYFILGAKNARECVITYRLSAWSSILGIHLSELILVLRIWAVWARGPKIGIVLVVISLACSIPAMVFFARFVEGIQFPLLQIPTPKNEDLGRCFYLMQNKDIYLCWIILMVFDSASFTLMAIPGFKAYRTGGTSNFVKVVYRDGVVCYALIFLVSLVNVIIILILPHDYVHVISIFERVLHSVLASHAILHIRKVAAETVIQDDSGWEHSGGGSAVLDSAYPSISFVSNAMQTVDEESRHSEAARRG